MSHKLIVCALLEYNRVSSEHCVTLSASRCRMFPACRRNLMSCVSKAMHRFCQSIQVLGTAAAAMLPSITSVICARVPVCQPETEENMYEELQWKFDRWKMN